MAEPLSFHDKTKASRPKELVKESTFWTGVLGLEKRPEGPKTEEDYLWVKCHKKITVKTIWEQYRSRNLVDSDFVLKLDSRVPSEDTMMKDLNTYGDRIIALEAVKASEVEARLASSRQPLQPTNHQLAPKTLSPAPKTFLPVSKTISPAPKDFQSQKRFVSPYNNLDSPKGIANGSPRDDKKPFSTLEELRKFEVFNHPAPPDSRPMSRTPPVTSWQSPQPTPALIPNGSTHAPVRDAAEGHLRSSLNNNERPPFRKFLEDFRKEKMTANPHLSSKEVYSDAWNVWSRTKSSNEALSTTTDRLGSQESQALEIVKPELDFKDEFSTDDASSAIGVGPVPLQSKSLQLHTMLMDASPEVLETAVEQGTQLLEKMKIPLLDKIETSPDAAQWVQQIDTIQKQAVKTRTIVGVVGNTGAGKSSVINAILDEERLVPTNCFRACTAVVTEISYNDGECPYRAEVEFVAMTDWEKELKVLFQDLLDGSGGVSRDCANEDTDAGVAYAKIKAVYPKKTKEDIANSSIEAMLEEVSHILGKTRKIEEKESQRFYHSLQRYVDSKEKATGNTEKDKKKERKEMEFWPLIKVVRIYVKAEALSTGAVIVDLPGVHDSNQARAAVAEGYMKQCTGLWIVAPITRAVDDKAAKTLLGESFKRQLKMDGGFNSVTFICSKTDDISLMEAQDSLGLSDEMGSSWEIMDRDIKKQRSLQKELEALKESKATYGEAMGDIDEQLEIWEALRDDVEDGKTVYSPPSKTNKKRKIGMSHRQAKKQRRSSSHSDGAEEDSQETEGSDSDDESSPLEDDRGSPLNEEQVSAKINELRSTKKEARKQRSELEEKMSVIRAEIKEAAESETKIAAEMAATCIAGRNGYSKGAIQQDFAAGIKELDQELAAEDDEENFNPDTEIRDYEEVAQSLPVFCVSSRAYQKLQGRFRHDPDVPGFKTIEETEVPLLQAHCKKLTEAGRTETCKRWMNKLSQLLNSLSLWASSDGTGANLTAEQRKREATFLEGSLKKLESGLDKVVEQCSRELKEELQDNIYDKYDNSITNAEHNASATATHWGAPVSRADRAAGGYFWSTYKAICRRNGVYSNAQGPHDWNVSLSDPMMKVLAPGWEKTFSRRTGSVMVGFARNAANLLREFHRDVHTRASKVGMGIAGLHMLHQQLGVHETILKDLSDSMKEHINGQQKEINREFTPVIERAMQGAYTACTNEAGPGSFMRMKRAMDDHVEQERHVMFRQATEEIKRRLSTMVRQVEETMNNRADEVFVTMRRDYRSVLGGPDAPQGQLLPKSERQMRKEVMHIIEGTEKRFRQVTGLKGEEGEEKVDGKDGEGNETMDQAPTVIEYGPDVKLETREDIFHVDDAPSENASDAPEEESSSAGDEDVSDEGKF